MAFETTAELQDAQLQELLGKMGATASRPERVYSTIGASWSQRVKLSFSTGTDPYGTPWLPLKTRQGQPLRDTGRMGASPDYESDAESLRVGLPPYDTKNNEGGAVNIPAVHQYGMTITPKNGPFLVFPIFKGTPQQRTVKATSVTIPARPFLPSEQQQLPEGWKKDAFNPILKALEQTLG